MKALTLSLSALLIVVAKILDTTLLPLLLAQTAYSQLDNSNTSFLLYQALLKFSFMPWAIGLACLMTLLVFWKDLRKLAGAASAVLVVSLLTGCGPVKVEPMESIDTNETAFVLPLEGENKDSQKQFESIDYLESKKVAAKRITIPLRERTTGRFYYNYEWVPTVRVIKVDRAPITREWTDGGKDKPIAAESKDSIGFSIGVNLTGYVEEEDTAKFLYYFRDKNLSQVIDTNIRGELQNLLSYEAAKRNLEQCKAEKNEMFETVKSKIVPYAKNYGVTLSSFGLAEGFTYEDKEIQDSINKAYVAEMSIQTAKQNKEMQIQENERALSIAKNQREQAEEFAKAAEARKKQVETEILKIQAEALLNFSQKWNGQVPSMLIVGQGTAPTLLNLPAPALKAE